MYYLPPDTADRIRVSRLHGTAFDNVQDYINFFGDRVIITGGGITATLPADGTVAVAPCTAWCKETDSDIAVGVFLNFAGAGNIALTDLAVNALYLDYNTGTPQVVVATSYLTFGFQQDHILLGAVYRDGNASHIVNSDRLGIQGINRTHLQLVEHSPHRTSGMIALAAGVRNLTVTAGVLHLGLIRIITPARDTTPAGGDTFTYWYYDGSLLVPAWVQVPGATQISNTQYNDVALGLVNFTPNRYGVHWVFMDFNGHLHVVYGQGDYTAAQAENADVPAPLPNVVTMFSVIVAKIICQEGAAVLTITYPWTFPFISALANDHHLLANLALDDHPQYIRHALATAANDFLVAPAAGSFVKQTLAQVTAILNWAADIAAHAALTTGIHGVGASTVDSVAARNAAIAAIVLDDLADVVDTAAVEGDMLYFDQVSGTWMVGARANLAELFANLTELNDLGDVQIPAPADLDFIYWDNVASKWVNISYALLLASIQGDTSLDELADVDVPAPADGDIFYYDNATGLWKPKAHTELTTGVHGLGAYGFTPSTLAAVTLYVDIATGNDADPGTSADPKQTIKGALDALPIGIAHLATICVRPGNYPENNVALEFGRFSTLDYITIKTINANDEDMFDNGLATGGGNNFLDDAGGGWSINQFTLGGSAYIWIYAGTGRGQTRQIASNTATRITTTANWAVNPNATSYYAIGGGATLTGTASYHLNVDTKKVNLYGFKHTGATSWCVLAVNMALGSVNNNYFHTASHGILSYNYAITYCFYNYSAASTTGFHIQLAAMIPRANVITGATTGVDVRYNGFAQMQSPAALLNYIDNCAKGIWIQWGGSCLKASAQVFNACATDIDPAVSTTVPRWFT